jgi:hypothetical protein
MKHAVPLIHPAIDRPVGAQRPEGTLCAHRRQRNASVLADTGHGMPCPDKSDERRDEQTVATETVHHFTKTSIRKPCVNCRT